METAWFAKIRPALLAAVSGSVILCLPAREPEPPPADGAPFSWNQNERWQELEERFRRARALGCAGVAARIDAHLAGGRSLIGALEARAVQPTDAVLDTVEGNLFELAPLIGGCLSRLNEYVALVTDTRTALKREAEAWDAGDQAAADRMYRLLWGGRAALEEVMLQAPPESVPALVLAHAEPSGTPAATILGVTIHSGDILVSRGGAAHSALIAIGSDYPGNFSHVGIVHVDSATGMASVVEANGHAGVVASPLEDYLHDVKLRIMVLRVRADVPDVSSDPWLPHRAAVQAMALASGRSIPYDFAMDHRDRSRMYCSEVVAEAYERVGIRLWTMPSSISARGPRAWLTALGVEHFEVMAPSDLEYDPQLRVVAEWRDPATLYDDHVDNVVTEALLEGAATGDRLRYAPLALPAVRIAKAYSVLADAAGAYGPVPDGMSAAAAARLQVFHRRHEEIKNQVLAAARAFRHREGYVPPEWELLRLAKWARDGALDGALTPPDDLGRRPSARVEQ